jgi:hypothetical protein
MQTIMLPHWPNAAVSEVQGDSVRAVATMVFWYMDCEAVNPNERYCRVCVAFQGAVSAHLRGMPSGRSRLRRGGPVHSAASSADVAHHCVVHRRDRNRAEKSQRLSLMFLAGSEALPGAKHLSFVHGLGPFNHLINHCQIRLQPSLALIHGAGF